MANSRGRDELTRIISGVERMKEYRGNKDLPAYRDEEATLARRAAGLGITLTRHPSGEVDLDQTAVYAGILLDQLDGGGAYSRLF